MDFSLTKSQKLIRKSAKEFFEKEYSKDRIRELKEESKGYDPKTWKKMVELGYVGLMLPEQYGGMDGDIIDLLILMKEIGRNIVPSPFFATAVLCSLPLFRYGTDEQKEQLLPAIAEEGAIWSYASCEDMTSMKWSDIELTAKRDGADFMLKGSKLFVPYANAAEKLLVIARTSKHSNPQDGLTLFIVDTNASGLGIELIPTTCRDARCEVRFNDVRVPESNVLGTVDQGWEIISDTMQMAALMKAAEMTGGARAVLDLTVKYVRERHQFNKPIGSFQAIQHRLVELTSEVDGLEHLVNLAAYKLNIGAESRMLVSMAKIKGNRVYHDVCYNGIYLHGAIGWTEEMDVGLYHIRSRSLISDGGNTDLHFRQVAEEMKQHQPKFRQLYG